jgi:hypothetical protein
MSDERSEYEVILDAASEGDRSATRRFFQGFAKTVFFVPDREQAQPLSDAPSYPSPFTTVLGIRDGERSVVPFFTRGEFIEEWCGAKLTFRELPGARLLETIPEGWWGALNPGQEVQKEFSPWELSTMKGGESTIDELVAELEVGTESEPVSVKPLSPESLPELSAALTRFCESERSATQAFLVQEVPRAESADPASIVVGVEVLPSSEVDSKQLRESLFSILRPHLIGGDPLKVIVSAPGEEILMGLLYGTVPVWRRTDNS